MEQFRSTSGVLMNQAKTAWSVVAACALLFLLLSLVSPEEGTAADVTWLAGVLLLVAAVLALVYAVRATMRHR